MEQKLNKTFESLKELLDILSCSKCKKSLHDPQQFLRCGHLSCISCTTNIAMCSNCQLCENDSDGNNIIERIIQACCRITEEVDFKRYMKNREAISKTDGTILPHLPKTDATESMDNKNSSNHIQSKPFKKARKLKRRTNLTNNENSKKLKWNTSILSFRIPKNINKRNYIGETKLQEECKKNHTENVKILLEAGADPNIACNAGWTPLQETADFNFHEIAVMLLESKADVNKPGYEGRTALHEAVKNDDLEMVELLLKYNANVDLIDNTGKKPIDYCQSKEIQDLLICDTESTKNSSIDNTSHGGAVAPLDKNGSNEKIVNNDKYNIDNVDSSVNTIIEKKFEKVNSENKLKESVCNTECCAKEDIETECSNVDDDVTVVFENISLINENGGLIKYKDKDTYKLEENSKKTKKITNYSQENIDIRDMCNMEKDDYSQESIDIINNSQDIIDVINIEDNNSVVPGSILRNDLNTESEDILIDVIN